MNAFDELREEARALVARGWAIPGSSLSLDADRLYAIRRDISLVAIRNHLTVGDSGKTSTVRQRLDHDIAYRYRD